MSADWKVSYKTSDSEDDSFYENTKINTYPEWLYLQPTRKQIELQKKTTLPSKLIVSPQAAGFKNIYSTFAIRSYQNNGPFGIAIIRIRVVSNKYAEYLIKIKTPRFSFAIWKRYRDFQKLANKIQIERGFWRNSIVSWMCMQRNKSLKRNLNHEYLHIKAFLLERFLHDVLYESYEFDIFSQLSEINKLQEPHDKQASSVLSSVCTGLSLGVIVNCCARLFDCVRK